MEFAGPWHRGAPLLNTTAGGSRPGSPASRPDAIVIGSGPNGLVAANLLADAGWDVLVLEAQPHYGGAVASGEVCAPGYVTDLYSAFYPLAAGSPVMRDLHLEDHGLRWAHAPDVVTHVTPEGRTATISRDLDRTAASLDAWSPGDGDAWRESVRQWNRVREPLIDALMRPFPPVGPTLRLATELGPGDGLRFARQAVLSVGRWGREVFGGDGGRLLFSGNAMHADLSPESAGGAFFGWILCMLAQDVGWPSPVGGAGRLADALVDRLKSRGGEVRCDARVVGVEVTGGRATGVRLADGTSVSARRAVLADVSAPSLFLDLVGPEHLPRRVVDDLSAFHWDDGTVKVNWALRQPIPWNSPDARGAGTVHAGVDLVGLGDYARDLRNGTVPEHPFALIGQMTTTDPTRSPADTESVWAYSHVPQGSVDDEDAMHRQAERIEDVIEAQAPGFKSLVVGRHVQLPRDLEKSNANLVGGALNGGTAAIFQQLVFRPVPGLGRPETPVKGLYLASASAHPGGGVHGAPGANAARTALAHAGAFGWLRGGAANVALRLVQGSPAS